MSPGNNNNTSKICGPNARGNEQCRRTPLCSVHHSHLHFAIAHRSKVWNAQLRKSMVKTRIKLRAKRVSPGGRKKELFGDLKGPGPHYPAIYLVLHIMLSSSSCDRVCSTVCVFESCCVVDYSLFYTIHVLHLFTAPLHPPHPPHPPPKPFLLHRTQPPKLPVSVTLYKSKYANSPTINSIITPRLRLPLVLLLLILGEQAYWLAYSRMRE